MPLPQDERIIQLANDLLAQFDQLHTAELNKIESKRHEIQAEMEVALSKNVKVANGLDGLLERIKLAHEIAGWAISLFITLLFLAIERLYGAGSRLLCAGSVSR